MKLCWISFLISSSILLHTASTANIIPGLRFFRSSRDSVNHYRIRDTVPENEKPDAEDADESPPHESANVDPVGKVLNRLTRPIGALQGLTRPEKPRQASPANEELSTANKKGAKDQPGTLTSDIPAPIAEPRPAPQQSSANDIGDTEQPADVDLPARQQPPAHPDTQSNDPAFQYFEPTMDENEDQQNQVSPNALSRLRQFASLTAVLAHIARIPRNIALQIDSVMAGLQRTYPTSTNVGAYLMGTRFLLRNPRALAPFDLMDRAGLGRLDEMVSNMPSVFNPVVNAISGYLSELVRRITVVLQRGREYARGLSERARNTLSGVSVARNNDSYSLSMPNLMDMVLKGRLASALDGYFAILQRGVISSLSGLGNSFSPSAPIIDPVGRNQAEYGSRSNPRFSAMRDYLRQNRYYN